jgi:adenylate cyclase
MSATQKTILVVDDEPDFRTYISTVLADEGFHIVTAEDGEDGLSKLRACTPDLVTLDVTMPTASGVHLYRELRENDAWKQIPVIFITGISQEFERFISTRKQMPPPDGYLPKPIDREALVGQVKKLLAA